MTNVTLRRTLLLRSGNPLPAIRTGRGRDWTTSAGVSIRTSLSNDTYAKRG